MWVVISNGRDTFSGVRETFINFIFHGTLPLTDINFVFSGEIVTKLFSYKKNAACELSQIVFILNWK